ncbi:hypothetical protein GCM10010389_49140 [Streptomyces echinoruber]|uniref:Uncharacterized protein n=1 Tax=Streptomyces echinoruber TaxID=68898 RepID=A0A918VKI8_9ACTN|nr:hypothetical protein GCM10010389_49140 [Streptomyces echinoruber]
MPLVLVVSPRTAARRPRQTLLGALEVLGCVRQTGTWPLPPSRPRAESGRHTRRVAAVRHHYDAGNSLDEAILGPSIAYSCAYWPSPAHL